MTDNVISEKGVAVVAMKGRDWALKFNFNAYRLFCRRRGVEFAKIADELQKDPIEGVLEMSYAAFQNACAFERVAVEIGYDEFCAHIFAGDNADEVLSMLSSALMNSMPAGNAISAPSTAQGASTPGETSTETPLPTGV
jgi:hypothetical protein